jgi:hypothetical protein
MQDTRSLNDQHPAVSPGLAGALVPLLWRVRHDAHRHELRGGLKQNEVGSRDG